MATLICQSGCKHEVSPLNKKEGFKMDELYYLLDCSIVEVQAIEGGQLMIIDEEGKLTGKETNNHATQLWSNTHKIPFQDLINSRDHIVGHVLLCSPEELQ